MKDSRLINLLKTFSNKEIEKADKFIRSPFFNENKKIITLFQALVTFHPAYELTASAEKYAFEKAFGSKSYKEKDAYYLMAELVKVLEQFLSQLEYEKKPLNLGINKLAQFSLRNQNNSYLKIDKQINKQIDKSKLRNANYFLNQYRLNSERSTYFFNNEKRNYNPYLQQSVHDLDNFYIGEKLRLLSELLAQQSVFERNYDKGFIEDIVPALLDNEEELSELGKIYLRIYLCSTANESDKHYMTLKELLNSHSAQFDRNEAGGMYLFAINFCIRKFNSGNQEYINELLELYKAMIEKDLLVDNNRISPWSYKNISTIGLRAGDLDWVRTFIEEYKPYLPKNLQKTSYYFNLANYHFYKKNFLKAQEFLLRVEVEDTYFNADYRTLLSKIYFERDEFEVLDAYCESYQMYLRRNRKVSQNVKKYYLNYIKFLKRLSVINPRDKKKLNHLRERIETTSSLADRKWLLHKVDELI